MNTFLTWAWFALVQLVSLLATVIGWFVLIPFCLAQAWTSEKPDQWNWKPLNSVYGNPEDGVSGKDALIWNTGGTAKVPYQPTAWAPWRAYCWSAWRNSADSLKFVFAWANGPLKQWQFSAFGREISIKAGWEKQTTSTVPVFSISTSRNS